MNSVNLPSTLKRIERATFDWCNDLTSIRIPRGVEYLEDECFSMSWLKEITLPSTLKEIGKNALKCDTLKKVWVEPGCALKVKKYVKLSVKVEYK